MPSARLRPSLPATLPNSPPNPPSSMVQAVGTAAASSAAATMASMLGGPSGPGPTQEHVNAVLGGMSANQLYDLMQQMRAMIQSNAAQARHILISNPQLTKALFQAQILLGMVKPPPAPPQAAPMPGPGPAGGPAPGFQPPPAAGPPPYQPAPGPGPGPVAQGTHARVCACVCGARGEGGEGGCAGLGRNALLCMLLFMVLCCLCCHLSSDTLPLACRPASHCGHRATYPAVWRAAARAVWWSPSPADAASARSFCAGVVAWVQ